MTQITLPNDNATTVNGQPNDFQDVLDNDVAIRDVVNGNLDNGNIAATANIAGSKLANASVEEAKLAAAVQAKLALTHELTLRDHDEVLAEESTNSTTFTDLTTPGPSVTIDVPEGGGFIAVLASVDLKVTGTAARVGITEATLVPTPLQLLSTSSTSYETMRSGSVAGSGASGSSAAFASPLVFPADAGTYTFTLKYNTALSSDTGTYKNRKLWAWCVAGF